MPGGYAIERRRNLDGDAPVGRTKIRMNQSELLRQFFGGYFCQDWSLEAPNWRSVIGLLASETSPDDVASVAMAIEELLQSTPSETELDHLLLEGFGCYFNPRPDLGGPSFRQWHSEVRAELRLSAAN